MLKKVSLADKFSQIKDHWNPRIAGELNGQHVKLVKIKGEFVWHHHEHEDEMFLVVDGAFQMELRDRVIQMNTGDFIIIPKGTEHRPVADTEASILLFEPATTVNTGNATGEMTKENLQWI